MLSIFHVLGGHLYVFFEIKSIQIFCPFLIGLFVRLFAIKQQEFCIYFGDQPLISYMILNYFLTFNRLSFHFVDGFLCCAEAFQLDIVPFIYLFFCCLCFLVSDPKVIAKTSIKELSMFFSRSFMVSGLLICFKLVFVYGVRYGYCFILLCVAVQFSQHYLLKKLSFPHCMLLAAHLL